MAKVEQVGIEMPSTIDSQAASPARQENDISRGVCKGIGTEIQIGTGADRTIPV